MEKGKIMKLCTRGSNNRKNARISEIEDEK